MRFFLSFIATACISLNAMCNWVPVYPGLNDYLTSITNKNGKLFMTGKKGAYFSSTGGITPGSWSRIESYASSSDSVIYNQSQFYSSAAAKEYSTEIIYFCGKDTVNSTGVIFSYNIQANTMQLVHVAGTGFNKITNNALTRIYAVGNNGLLVSFHESNPVVITIPTSFAFDLTSIDAYMFQLKIGANDYIIDGLVDNTSPATVSFTTHSFPGRNFKDVKFYDYSSTSGYAVGENMMRFQGSSHAEPHQYYADSLMGNSLLQASGFYVGTTNGIYRSIPSTDIFEFFPTSIGHNVQSICEITTSHLIACTANGMILHTNASGGTSEPYAQIDIDGACLNVSQQIRSTKGSVNNCTTYIDNVFNNSNCFNYFNYTFTTLGTHEIKLVVSNSSYSKTITKTILVVSAPAEIPALLSDDTLCKQETVDITLLNSQNGVYYSLYQSGSNTLLGSSGIGDGSNLSFQSNLLNQSGNYYIRATNSQATSCSSVFTSTFNLIVEKPEAKLHFDVINAEPGESVRFYQKATGAVNFEWHFSNSPSITSSNLPNLTNSFSGTGSSEVTLIAGTLNNCYDTAVVRGPFIYEPYADTSWLLVNAKISGSTGTSGYGEDIKQTIKSHSSGYLVAGNYLDRIVESRIGDSAILTGYGGYVAKYNDLGILKWCIQTDPLDDSSYPIEFVSDITEDWNGNIYVVGKTPAPGGMIDNKGNAIGGNQGFIIKLDPLGHTIWNRTTDYTHGNFVHINHDYDNSVYVTSLNFSNPAQVFPFRLNGVTQDSLRFNEAVCQSCNIKDKILKIKEDGQLEYDFMVEISATNSYTPPQVVFDTLNNLYVWGSKELQGTIHAPITGEIIELTTSTSNFGGKMYISKFDVNGNYLWKVEGHTQAAPNDHTEAHALISDGAGNLYLTGQNNFDNPSNPQVIVNADHTPSHFYGGKYFVAKINTHGMTEWIQGDYKSGTGAGFDLILDGDTLYTVGASRKNNDMDFPFELTGTNTSVSMVASPYNYFIAKYLTDGTILNSTLNGPSDLISGLFLSTENHPKLIQLNDGYFLLNKSISNNALAPDTAIDFGFSLIPSGFQDGTQLKFKLSQGIEFLPHYYTEITYPVCYGASFTYPDGTILPSVTYYNSRIDSLVSVNGIDSIVKQQVVVLQDYYTSSYLAVCAGSDVTLSDGTTITNIQNTTSVQLELQSVYGCDSTSSILIYVTGGYSPITQSANHLSVQSPNASFQWVDCNLNYFPIPNQVYSSFTPVEDGSYAVIVTSDGCTDTSDCYMFDYYANLSVTESADPSVSIAPNPTGNKTTISFGRTIGLTSLTVYSNDGRKILESSIQGVNQYELDLSAFEKGTYFVKITTENQEDSGFLIVKN